MSQKTTDIQEFSARVRLLIERCKQQKQENERLSELVCQQTTEIENLRAMVKKLNEKYDALMAAKMLNITDGDIDETKKRVNNLIRTVNQCITLLSEK